MRPPVLASLATIPERERWLEQVVAALAPQADMLRVALNDYPRVPAWLNEYSNVHAEIVHGGGGDAEKFRGADSWDGIVATCDDDIAYPADYIAELVAGLDRWPGRAVSFHGGVTLGWNGSAKAASHKSIRCLGGLDHDDPTVNVVGTGTLAWDATVTPVWRSLFRHANCADVQFAVHAHRQGIPLACLDHRKGWLKALPAGPGIYEANRDADGSVRDTRHVRRELMERDWSAPSLRPKVRVSIATCDRPLLLHQLLTDLARETAWCDLEVAVFHDPTLADYTTQREFAEAFGWKWTTFPRRRGRENYWRIVDAQFKACWRSRCDWFVFLPDDVRLHRYAIPKALDVWAQLPDPSALTLWRLKGWEGVASWTGRRPIDRGDAIECFHVDGNFLCRRVLLDVFEHRMPRTKLTTTGSGVGRYMSKVLYRQRRRMFKVPVSVTYDNSGGSSVMNPEANEVRPYNGITL